MVGESGRNLIGGRVTILGGGGIASALVRMLKPFDCHVTVVRNRIEEMEGVDEVLAADDTSTRSPAPISSCWPCR